MVTVSIVRNVLVCHKMIEVRLRCAARRRLAELLWLCHLRRASITISILCLLLSPYYDLLSLCRSSLQTKLEDKVVQLFAIKFG